MRTNGTQADGVLPLLLVTTDDQHERTLRAILDGTPYAARRVLSCSEALNAISDLNPSVLLVEADSPAGNWKHLLDCVLNLPASPPFIVFSPFADDRLWAEALDLGGYDVLAAPFAAEEVLRTISSASGAHGRKPVNGSAESAAAT